MMLSNCPSPESPMPASVPAAIPDASVDAGGNHSTHADYSLQPLAMPSLDHYVTLAAKGERFHVH